MSPLSICSSFVFLFCFRIQKESLYFIIVLTYLLMPFPAVRCCRCTLCVLEVQSFYPSAVQFRAVICWEECWLCVISVFPAHSASFFLILTCVWCQDAERIVSPENPELSEFPSSQPGVGQITAVCISPTAESSSFQVHSAAFFPQFSSNIVFHGL